MMMDASPPAVNSLVTLHMLTIDPPYALLCRQSLPSGKFVDVLHYLVPQAPSKPFPSHTFITWVFNFDGYPESASIIELNQFFD
jgi:hypothetical protein